MYLWKELLGMATIDCPQINLTIHHTKQLNALKVALRRLKKVGIIKSNCLIEAILIKRYFQRKENITFLLHLGIHKKDNYLKAHAWLTNGNLPVHGVKGSKSFHKLVCYL